ncbi:maker615 [Drosophila busckii]|uniref:CG18508 n=1 Tax=Drosophila busckii TaxID=30019 RepID=A0A0M4E6B3_DROBS|nr:UPF0729 protein CG18508-like [Drosophila busckii]ALC38090.1 CG18508 [Drosophila busckii]ALC40361.1 maker615 [Drosophila busckii]
MVCIPCIMVPLVLYIWHKFVQPIMLRYWNPWAKKDAAGNVIKQEPPQSPFQCVGGTCRFVRRGAKAKELPIDVARDEPVKDLQKS